MILVTGGAGRIGRYLVERLLKDGQDVRVLALETKGGTVGGETPRTDELEKKGAEIFFGDLLDKKTLEIALQGIETVYHLAAIVDYLSPKKLMWKVNVEGTKNLMEACKEAGVKKIIYLSSTAVYGKKILGMADEKTETKPTNFYGKTKLEAEGIILENSGIVLRSADTYFPGFTEGYHAVFSMLEKGKMRIIGSGKNRIQYIYIDDLVDALVLAKDKGKAGEIYNIAGDDILTQEELYRLACGYLGVEPPKKHTSAFVLKFFLNIHVFASKLKRKKPKMISEYIDKIAADRVFIIEKARKELGFNPKVYFAEGIKRMVEYYKEHKE